MYKESEGTAFSVSFMFIWIGGRLCLLFAVAAGIKG